MTQAAGKLNHRIRLESLETSQDANGETVETWTHEGDVWANVSPVSGKEFISSAAMQSQIVARITVRYRSDIQATWRILFRDRYYNIEAVLPDVVSGLEYLTLPVSEGIRVEPDSITGPSLNDYSLANPMYIAHRGGAMMYPENTVEAYRASLVAGNVILEQDVRLLFDGSLGLMHDSTVDRTTTSVGNTNSFTAATWENLDIDANDWHGSNFGNNLVPPTLPPVIAEFNKSVILMPEAKDASAAPGIIQALDIANVRKDQIIIQGFDITTGAAAVAAGYQAMIVLTDTTTEIPAAQSAGIQWVGLGLGATDPTIAAWKAAGLKVVIYTITRRYHRDARLGVGAFGLFCDDPQYIKATAPIATQDTFSNQTWMPGMVSRGTLLTEVDRGRFFTPNYWGWSTASASAFVLQGWACPIKSQVSANNFVIELTARFDSAAGGDTTRFASAFVCNDSDHAFTDSAVANPDEVGYHILMRKNGTVQVLRRNADGTNTSLATQAGTLIGDMVEAHYRITVTPTTVRIARLATAGGAESYGTTATDSTFRGGYFHLGKSGINVKFRRVIVS